MNEADTRALLIDKHLEAAGWVTEGDVRVYREFRINDGTIQQGGKRSPSLSADYVLEYRGKKLAAIEAKSDEVAVSEGVGQAKQYATKLRLPFGYAANGKKIYEMSLSKGEEGDVPSFPPQTSCGGVPMSRSMNGKSDLTPSRLKCLVGHTSHGTTKR